MSTAFEPLGSSPFGGPSVAGVTGAPPEDEALAEREDAALEEEAPLEEEELGSAAGATEPAAWSAAESPELEAFALAA
ncbi:MAG TPA: hypothetical protein VEK07_22130 [Polyangiaceae bacterium]|nr:hypothetical protein [Polyangiaceae bacterium]